MTSNTIMIFAVFAFVSLCCSGAEGQPAPGGGGLQQPPDQGSTATDSLQATLSREGNTDIARKSPDDIYFKLYVSNSTASAALLSAADPASLTPFTPHLPLVVVIHGYSISKTYLGFMEQIRDELFKKGQYNVLLVNWTKLSQNKLYNVAAGNVVFVGEQIADLLQALEASAGLVRTSVHLVGFSLGAHVAGHAGRLFQGLGRITGLDPAGPLFNYHGPEVTLDLTDADFVDVIHTDSGSLVEGHFGYNTNQGHVDFFVNGGSEMPGCEGLLAALVSSMTSDDDAETALDSCSHVKAYQYFIESINSPSAVAYRCTSYDAYLDGLCTDANSAPNALGFPATNTHYGNFYSQTQSAAPYLSRQLLVEGSVSVLEGGLWSTIQGAMILTVAAPGRKAYTRTPERTRRYNSGSSFRASLPLPLLAPLEDNILTITFLEARRPLSWLWRDSPPLAVTVTVTDTQEGGRKLYSCWTSLPDQEPVIIKLRASPCRWVNERKKKPSRLQSLARAGLKTALQFLSVPLPLN